MLPTPRTFKAGQTLFTDGDPSQSLFILRKGAVSIRKKRGQGHIEVGKAVSGEVIGELSFFDRRPRSATAVAIIEVEVIEVTFESLDKIYQNIPDYLKTIMHSMAERLRRANELIVRLQKENPSKAEVIQRELDAEMAASLSKEGVPSGTSSGSGNSKT